MRTPEYLVKLLIVGFQMKMNQYHVFKTEYRPEYPKSKVVTVNGGQFTVVLSNGVVTGKFSSEEYKILEDCRPGSAYKVVNADSYEQAAEIGAKELSN